METPTSPSASVTGLSPIRASSRADAVYAALRDAIVGGRLEPGARLSESGLGAELGVSRTPVREALRRLSEIDLVEVEVSRQYRVSPVDPGRLSSVYVVFAELVGLAARLARPRLTPSDLEQIRTEGGHLIHELAPAPEGGPRPGFGTHVVDLVLDRLQDDVVAEAIARYRPQVVRALNLTAHRIVPDALAQWAGGILAALDDEGGELLGASIRAYAVQLGNIVTGLLREDPAPA